MRIPVGSVHSVHFLLTDGMADLHFFFKLLPCSSTLCRSFLQATEMPNQDRLFKLISTM